jgi:metal-sulfur cluster biosynthetic enzyme
MSVTGAEKVAELVDEVYRALDAVVDPCSVATGRPMGMHQMGLVGQVDIEPGGIVHVQIRLTSPTCMFVGVFVDEIRDYIGAVPGVRDVHVSFDGGLDWTPDLIRKQPSSARHEE